jgi:hypothetical protein
MPGVYRASTWVDILDSVMGQNSSTADTATSGVGYFAEAQETMAVADAVTTTAAAPAGWDQGAWGSVGWS